MSVYATQGGQVVRRTTYSPTKPWMKRGTWNNEPAIVQTRLPVERCKLPVVLRKTDGRTFIVG
jgi:hypothetical protein